MSAVLGSVSWSGGGQDEVGTWSSLLNSLFSRDDIFSKEHIGSSEKDTEYGFCSFCYLSRDLGQWFASAAVSV